MDLSKQKGGRRCLPKRRVELFLHCVANFNALMTDHSFAQGFCLHSSLYVLFFFFFPGKQYF